MEEVEKKKSKEPLTIEDAIKQLDKDYGKGSVIYGDKMEKCTEVVSTGSLRLDIATGIGGVPTDGKIIEIIGWESCGKSTLTQTIIGNYQKKHPDKKVVLVDSEFSLDDDYARSLGVNIEKLLLIQIDEYAGEGAYNKVKTLMDTGKVGLVVYDSYNGLQPSKVVNGEVGDNQLGLHARMTGTAVMKANADGAKYGATSIFVGQFREKIGVMFGPTETTQGGNALKFYAHMRFRMSRSTTKDNSVMEGDTKLGNQHKVEVFKNKLSAPFKKAEFNIIYGEGIDKYTELVDTGHDFKVFKKYGKSITVEEEKMEIEEFITRLRDNDKLFEEWREKILKIGLNDNS